MTSAVLDIRNVFFVRQGKTLLADVSVTVREGERWALLGPNGAGKSTLLNLCGAITHPTRGTVEVLGKQLGRVDIRELRERIGHVNPRHPLQSALSIEEVVLTGLTGTIETPMHGEWTRAQRTRARDLLEMLGIGRIREESWLTLSQGERGRALIARALIADPKLLLLDEPATGLDVAAREQLMETVDEVHATHPRLASILVTHHLEELPSSTTHALLIAHGRITASGHTDAVLTTHNVTHAFEHPIAITRDDGRWSARASR
jgi:iron complex transport system ATP-binding protein